MHVHLNTHTHVGSLISGSRPAPLSSSGSSYLLLPLLLVVLPLLAALGDEVVQPAQLSLSEAEVQKLPDEHQRQDLDETSQTPDSDQDLEKTTQTPDSDQDLQETPQTPDSDQVLEKTTQTPDSDQDLQETTQTPDSYHGRPTVIDLPS